MTATAMPTDKFWHIIERAAQTAGDRNGLGLASGHTRVR